MGILPVYHIHVVPTEAGRRHQMPWNQTGCDLLCGCWEFNSSHLEKHPVLLATEPSF